MSTTTLDHLFADSAWWAALRLGERDPASVPDDPPSADRGRRRLASWRSEKRVSGGVEIDLTHWRRLGIDEDRLVLLLGESTDSLRARIPQRPAWLQTLAEAYTHDHDSGHRHDPHPRPVLTGPAAPPAETFGLLELLGPLGRHHHRLLHDRIRELQESHGNKEDIGHDHPLLRPDLLGLAGMITATLVREMHAQSRDGRLAGDTPQARFASYVETLRDPVTAVRTLLKYPVLARELVEELTTWVRVRARLAERLLTALPELAAVFGLRDATLAGVADIAFGAGDTHNGGQSVAIIEFTDGRRVVYKPRSIAVERHFYGLTEWLNARGPAHPLRSLRIVDRGDHGWTEFIAEAPCADAAQAGRFVWRQGAGLALLHVLRAQDMHHENVIAAGEHPVFVDLEAAFQLPVFQPRQVPGGMPAAAMEALTESVLAIGLLPRPVVRREAEGARVVDMSGFTGAPGQLSPMALPHWQEAGTDRMRIERGYLPMGGGKNLAKVHDTVVAVDDFRGELLAGFEQVYRTLMTHRDELVAAGGPVAAFEGDQIRPILRSTMIYARLLLESWHPDVLADGLDRECLLGLLSLGHQEKAARWEIVDSEYRQVLQRDVPCFGTTAGSEHLHDDDGLVAENYLPMSGLEAVRRRVRDLSEEDLRRQLWIIDASLSAAQVGELTRDKAVSPRPLATTGPDAGTDTSLALRAASRLGDLLLDTARREPGTGRPSWLSLGLVAERYWSIVPTGFESFTGLTGIGLFLAHLGEAGQDERYRASAEAIAEMLVEQAGHWAGLDERRLTELNIGAFTELGGSMLTLAHLGALWRSEVLLKSASQLVPLLTARFAGDRALDVISGTAGAALALLALHHVSPDDRTEAGLLQAGDALLAAAERHRPGIAWTTVIGSRRPLLGFSHGVSGIATTLARLAGATGRSRFAEAAAEAVRYEHAQFDAAAGNWPDERDITPPGVFMNAWCHGAAGIGIARAELLGELGMAEVALDLHRAVASVEHDLFQQGGLMGVGNDSLCHGDLGLAETLLTAGMTLDRPDLVDKARQVARTVAYSVLAGEERCGVPRAMSIPGLMMGIAGIGYGLLRTAAPDQVPSVLAVEAPVLGSGR